MVRRSVLDVSDARYELPRSPRRRVGQGIRQPSYRFSGAGTAPA